MVTAAKTYYTAFGMRLTSEIPLPELTRSMHDTKDNDAEFVYGDLSFVWNEERDAHRHFCVCEEGRILFYIPATAVFSIEAGRKVTIHPMDGADEKKIRVYLLGSCMGALLFQRHMLPLHGSAVVIDDKAYAFVGESGAGKSTLAAAFLSKGYSLLTDDVIALSFTDAGVPYVAPAYPQQKLWQESIDGLGMESGSFVPLYEELSKFAVPVAAKFHTKPVVLGGVIELVRTEGEQWDIQPITKLNRFPLLFQHTYRNHFVSLLHLEQWHFAGMANIARHCEIFQLRRPTAGFTAQQLASQIIQLVNNKLEFANKI
ncbi:aldolase [Paenibacillus nasutitermitis]|uniref:HPr kinase n=1 Tax=Paenibacillus nasutitermitis TaxID=1652958 RepID=A0A916Z4A2_9BACL|nr:aldolase [Paenibacillus nasutitermitis]GGD76105.1 HPr kinase [Paenibacillus nasutitermitis]